MNIDEIKQASEALKEAGEVYYANKKDEAARIRFIKAHADFEQIAPEAIRLLLPIAEAAIIISNDDSLMIEDASNECVDAFFNLRELLKPLISDASTTAK